MKKSKGQSVDLLYMNNTEPNKKSKNKTSKTKKSRTKKGQNDKIQTIDLDNEIIIGLTPKKEEPNKKEQNKKRQRTKQQKTKGKQTQKKNNNKSGTNKKIEKDKSPKKKRKLKIVKWITIIVLFLTVIILFMMSSLFNIKQIVVINNSKVSTEEIIALSQLTINTNMFKTLNETIRNNIKENAYIEDVKITKNLNGTITIDIKERVPTYILQLENNYAYINNQGYILEVSENPLQLPIITGFAMPEEEINVGNRLIVEDLNKLDDIIEIMEASKNTPLENIITQIDISDDTDYKLTVASEEKIIRFGDITNAKIKLQMAGKVMSNEKSKKGEIYFQENAKRAIFREEV